LCAILAGCRALLPIPDLRTPLDRAHELEDKCKHQTSEAVAAIVAPGVIDSVEAALSYTSSGPVDRQAHLRGATIHLRPLPAASRETIERTLECHQANATLGEAQASVDDPYVLPGRWLDIEVQSEGDGFAALVRVDKLEDAREVLDRARRFARGSASP
jgi:hypothetical protein